MREEKESERFGVSDFVVWCLVFGFHICLHEESGMEGAVNQQTSLRRLPLPMKEEVKKEAPWRVVAS